MPSTENFGSGAWAAGKWATTDNVGTIDVLNGRGRHQYGLTTGYGNGAKAILTETQFSYPRFSMAIDIPAASAIDHYLPVTLLGDGVWGATDSSCSNTGYRCTLELNTNVIRVESVTGNVQTTRASGTPPTLSGGGQFMFEGEYTESRVLRARVWAFGTAKPAWQVSWTDTVFVATKGYFGFCWVGGVSSIARTAYTDDILVSDSDSFAARPAGRPAPFRPGNAR